LPAALPAPQVLAPAAPQAIPAYVLGRNPGKQGDLIMSRRPLEFAVAAVVGMLVLVSAAAFAGEAAAGRETPAERDARMQWWREARFGMFIHWGLYAVPAGQWEGKPAPSLGEWIMDAANIPIPQ